ncbi:hypothetical protein Ahy_A07g033502 isoform F [Arachis hypogaea]|uniref:Uncharacterized protein n=1 Tax=Arachis hypogaea TaxID=3818 RepID=A0A445C9E9_ARAHY|nr:hypothetical protein Ahy_A07g033502 isoform F [Arachis hypogaea]
MVFGPKFLKPNVMHYENRTDHQIGQNRAEQRKTTYSTNLFDKAEDEDDGDGGDATTTTTNMRARDEGETKQSHNSVP